MEGDRSLTFPPAAPNELQPWLWSGEEPTVSAPIRVLPFQAAVIRARLATDGGHVWAPAGSGKTLMAHAWGLTITPGPLLIVTRSDAKETHYRELRRLTTTRPYVLKPVSDRRVADVGFYAYLAAAIRESFRPVVIVGWEMLPRIEGIISDFKPQAVVFDESHKAKGIRRYKWTAGTDGKPHGRPLDTVSAVAARIAATIPYRLATTATAIRHRTWDLWGQLSLVEPKAWGKTVSKFGLRYCDGKPGEWGGLDMSGTSNVDELKQRLAFTVSHVPIEILTSQLPPKRRQVIRIPVSDQIKGLADEDPVELKRLRAEAARGSGTAERALNEKRIEDAASRKRGWIPKTLPEYFSTGKGKVLVFTGRRRDAEDLERRIAKLGVQVWMAHGGHAVDARQAIQDAYMAHPGPCVLVGTVDAWGESKNLQDTDVLLMVQLPYTPGKIDQAEGRGHRLGTSRPFLVIYLIAEDTIDERVAGLVIDKLPAVQQITGGGAIGGLDDALKGIEDREAVIAGLASMFNME
jgi:superfamily II DNA or RNA helicase